jgi:DNA-binding transcriptional regulator LsrR (DeoR family)
MRNILEDQERLQEIVKCAILYSKDKKNVEIAGALNISAVRVTRNIADAKELGILKIEVHPPPEVAIAGKLKKEYKLREVYVFPIGVADEVMNMLAKLTAHYLEKLLDDKKEKIKCVAIGPGRTTSAFVRALSDEERPGIIIGSTTSATKTETHIASNTLIGIASGKWRCDSRRFETTMSIEEQKAYADVFVLGVGRIHDMGGVTALALFSETDIHRELLEKELYSLAGRDGIGIINYQPIDREGNPLDWDLKQYKKVLEPTLLKLDVIKEIAKDKNRRVVCIASNNGKADAIRAGLKGGYFNVLITDYETAKELVRQGNGESKQ